MSPRWNGDSPTPSLASECAWGRGSPNSNDWRQSLVLCLLCAQAWTVLNLDKKERQWNWIKCTGIFKTNQNCQTYRWLKANLKQMRGENAAHISDFFCWHRMGVFHMWCAYEIHLLKINSAPLPPNIIYLYTTIFTMQYAEYSFLIHLLYTSRYLRDWHREGWWVGGGRRTMRLIEGNAKCRHP
jgi:hypothetical protein